LQNNVNTDTNVSDELEQYGQLIMLEISAILGDAENIIFRDENNGDM
jgi:hypothetical protein